MLNCKGSYQLWTTKLAQVNLQHKHSHRENANIQVCLTSEQGNNQEIDKEEYQDIWALVLVYSESQAIFH